MITLRILTRKSKLGVGQYANETVQKLLDRQMYPALRKLYYTYESISFQDDILDEIHAEIRIDKPGTDPTAMEKVNEKLFKKRMSHLNATGNKKLAMGEWAHNQANKRHEERRQRTMARNKEYLTKGTLQAANHGHIFINVKEQ